VAGYSFAISGLPSLPLTFYRNAHYQDKLLSLLASFNPFALSLKIFFALSTDMAVKTTNIYLYRSLTDERQHEPFEKLKLVSHHVVAVKGNDHDALWYFHNVGTSRGHFI
jgi:hypothetical protein